MARQIGKLSGRQVTTATDPIEARRTEGAQAQLEAAKGKTFREVAEALHFLTEAKRTEDDSRTAVRMGWEIRTGCFDRAKPLMKRIRKLKARTAAGIYAKALVVRESVSGAPMLAMSLAEDLITCPGLRASRWPAERESTA